MKRSRDEKEDQELSNNNAKKARTDAVTFDDDEEENKGGEEEQQITSSVGNNGSSSSNIAPNPVASKGIFEMFGMAATIPKMPTMPTMPSSSRPSGSGFFGAPAPAPAAASTSTAPSASDGMAEMARTPYDGYKLNGVRNISYIVDYFVSRPEIESAVDFIQSMVKPDAGAAPAAHTPAVARELPKGIEAWETWVNSKWLDDSAQIKYGTTYYGKYRSIGRFVRSTTDPVVSNPELFYPPIDPLTALEVSTGRTQPQFPISNGSEKNTLQKNTVQKYLLPTITTIVDEETTKIRSVMPMMIQGYTNKIKGAANLLSGEDETKLKSFNPNDKLYCRVKYGGFQYEPERKGSPARFQTYEESVVDTVVKKVLTNERRLHECFFMEEVVAPVGALKLQLISDEELTQFMKRFVHVYAILPTDPEATAGGVASPFPENFDFGDREALFKTKRTIKGGNEIDLKKMLLWAYYGIYNYMVSLVALRDIFTLAYLRYRESYKLDLFATDARANTAYASPEFPAMDAIEKAKLESHQKSLQDKLTSLHSDRRNPSSNSKYGPNPISEVIKQYENVEFEPNPLDVAHEKATLKTEQSLIRIMQVSRRTKDPRDLFTTPKLYGSKFQENVASRIFFTDLPKKLLVYGSKLQSIMSAMVSNDANDGAMKMGLRKIKSSLFRIAARPEGIKTGDPTVPIVDPDRYYFSMRLGIIEGKKTDGAPAVIQSSGELDDMPEMQF